MEKYISYIQNAGNPTIEEFIEDWEPIGSRLIEDLKDSGLIFIKDNRIYLAEKP